MYEDYESADAFEDDFYEHEPPEEQNPQKQKRSKNPKLTKEFRKQAHATGAAYIIVSLTQLFIVFYFGIAEKNISELLASPIFQFISIACVIYIFLGIFVCLKQQWAIYAGLGFCYFILIAGLLKLLLCALVMVIVAVVQTHMLINAAGKLRKRGIPLDALP